MKFRRQMNAADEQAATKAVDSLINYETVKYFNAEAAETSRFNSSMRAYEDAAVLSRTSLAAVNVGQGAIIALGLVLIMGIAGHDIHLGELTVGNFVTVNTYLLQLYLPLNFLGWVYREIRQSLVDLERMFTLLDEYPDVRDPDNAPQLHLSAGEVCFENVHFAYKDRAILRGVSALRFRLGSGLPLWDQAGQENQQYQDFCSAFMIQIRAACLLTVRISGRCSNLRFGQQLALCRRTASCLMSPRWIYYRLWPKAQARRI